MNDVGTRRGNNASCATDKPSEHVGVMVHSTAEKEEAQLSALTHPGITAGGQRGGRQAPGWFGEKGCVLEEKVILYPKAPPSSGFSGVVGTENKVGMGAPSWPHRMPLDRRLLRSVYLSPPCPACPQGLNMADHRVMQDEFYLPARH